MRDPGRRRYPSKARTSLRGSVVLALSVLCLGCPGSEVQAPPSGPLRVEHLQNPALESLGLPFSEAVRAGNTLYLSGQIGNLPGTLELVPGGIGEETRQTMENIRAAVERHGYRLDQIVKCTIFLADIAEWPAMNEVYRTYFPESPPARSAVAGSGLALGARVEIECIAAVDG